MSEQANERRNGKRNLIKCGMLDIFAALFFHHSPSPLFSLSSFAVFAFFLSVLASPRKQTHTHTNTHPFFSRYWRHFFCPFGSLCFWPFFAILLSHRTFLLLTARTAPGILRRDADEANRQAVRRSPVFIIKQVLYDDDDERKRKIPNWLFLSLPLTYRFLYLLFSFFYTRTHTFTRSLTHSVILIHTYIHTQEITFDYGVYYYCSY